MTCMDARSELSQSLQAHRAQRGNPSYSSIARALVEMLGAYAPTDQTVANWHKGQVDPKTADIVIAGALADYYGVVLSDLHVTFADRWDSCRDLLGRATGWFSTAAA